MVIDVREEQHILKNQVMLRLMTASKSHMCCSCLKIELNAHHIEAATKSLLALEKKESKNTEAAPRPVWAEPYFRKLHIHARMKRFLYSPVLK